MKYDVTEIKALTYLERLIGLRFNTSEGILDADKTSLTKLGVLNINIPNRVELFLKDDILISQEELDSGITTVDISNDTDKLSNLVESIKEQEGYQHLFIFQKPYEQSLKTFMEDENWETVRIKRNDEYNNQHHIIQPDGNQWRGGWISKNRDSEKAKSNFHYDQVRWAIHRGNKVSEESLLTYPDLKQYIDLIAEIKQLYKPKTDKNGELVISVDTGDEETVREVYLNKFPEERYNQRTFVTPDLILPFLSEVNLIGKFLDARELSIIAITHIVTEHKNEKTKDPYYV